MGKARPPVLIYLLTWHFAFCCPGPTWGVPHPTLTPITALCQRLLSPAPDRCQVHRENACEALVPRGPHVLGGAERADGARRRGEAEPPIRGAPGTYRTRAWGSAASAPARCPPPWPGRTCLACNLWEGQRTLVTQPRKQPHQAHLPREWQAVPRPCGRGQDKCSPQL